MQIIHRAYFIVWSEEWTLPSSQRPAFIRTENEEPRVTVLLVHLCLPFPRMKSGFTNCYFGLFSLFHAPNPNLSHLRFWQLMWCFFFSWISLSDRWKSSNCVVPHSCPNPTSVSGLLWSLPLRYVMLHCWMFISALKPHPSWHTTPTVLIVLVKHHAGYFKNISSLHDF